MGTSGAAYISYHDVGNTALRYATNVSGSWVTTTVDNTSSLNTGQYTSIAVGTSGAAYISYYDVTNTNLMYATNVSGSWGTTTVDSTGTVGEHTSIALDSSGKAYISYYDYSNGFIKYATNASGVWVTETVDYSDAGYFTSIALDSSSKAYISYYAYNDLHYATNASGSWVTETVDSSGDVGKYSSIALDSLGRAYISYYDATNFDLKYATNATSSSAPTVTTGSATSVTLSTAMLNATIIPNGTTTTVWFQYGTSSGSYSTTITNGTISTNLNSGSWGASSTIDSLTPWTTYYYRAMAQNGGGTTYGNETSFTPLPWVAGGYFHTVALKTDGTVWAWGRNDYGQLGNGTTTNSSTKVQVSGLSDVIAINAGDYYSAALKSDGTVWMWGDNSNGQLGNGTTTNSSTPVQASGLSGVLSIEGVGGYHNVVIGSNTSALSWGYNSYGQLGNGTTTSSSTQVQVSGLTDGGVMAVWGGVFHSLAIKSSGNGNVYAWGYNDYGQLGNGTTTGTNTPAYLSSFSSSGTTTAVRGGWFHSLA